jgi:hypothetical protein
VTRFVAETDTLRAAAGKVVRGVPDRPPVPVLKGILVTAAGGQVELVATDDSQTFRTQIPATVHASGQVLVDGLILARIARHLPGPSTTVELDGWALVVASGRARYRLMTMPQDDYPTDLPADTDLTRVRAAGPDSRERALTATAVFPVRPWKPPRATPLFEPADLQPGTTIGWTRRLDTGPVEMVGQVWSAAPSPRTVWVIPDGECRAVLVGERVYGEGAWATGDYRKVNRLEEITPHWVASPSTATSSGR